MAALAVFLALPVFSLLVQPLAGRLVWTVLIAFLPLFIVLVGYHRWRRICPLAFFSQIPTLLRRPGSRRASPWLQANAYYVSFSVFFFSLWIRLIATNGSGVAIAAFFTLIALAALLSGVLYTGKTWCNYVCPLSFIEKVYTEPHGLRESTNSQCTKCTACKTACPDINEENGYWREIDSRPKRFVYYAYPGLIFGFYLYYYLQSGTWEYYFGGSWTHEPGLIRTAFSPGTVGPTAGFFFLPQAPRALASALTLAGTTFLSFGMFRRLETWVDRWLCRWKGEAEPSYRRHILLSVSAFVSFVTFYTFAGQPTLLKIPWAPQVAGVVTVLVASLFLVRRMGRTRQAFTEQTLARSILKRWEWTDLGPPKELHDAYLIHTIRTRDRAMEYGRLVEIYREAVRETLASGLLTRLDVQRLETLRGRLEIKPADHEEIMAALAEEERARLIDPAMHLTAEKRLQLESYACVLRQHVERVFSSEDAAGDVLMRVRAEYGVTAEEHAAVLERVLTGADAGAVAVQITEDVRVIENSSETLRALDAQPAPAHSLLAERVRVRRARAVERLLSGLNVQASEDARSSVRDGLASQDRSRRAGAIETLRACAPRWIGERLLAAHQEAASSEAAPLRLAVRLQAQTESTDPYARAAAIHALAACGEADDETIARLIGDEHEIVRATALRLRGLARRGAGGEGTPAEGVAIDTILALRAVPLFSTLAPESLARLARSSTETSLATGEIVCREGEPGDEVFVLLEGDVEILRAAGAAQECVGLEGPGSVIGEMAVLDPAPRAATVRAGMPGARILRLAGRAFRESLAADPSLGDGVIRALARRLRTHRQHDRRRTRRDPTRHKVSPRSKGTLRSSSKAHSYTIEPIRGAGVTVPRAGRPRALLEPIAGNRAPPFYPCRAHVETPQIAKGGAP